MESIYKIEDRLLSELDEIASKVQNGEIMTHDCLDDIKDIAETLNSFSTYTAMKESGGFSRASGGGYSNGYSNAGGYSNARGRSRDSMGRYSRNSGYSRGGYSRMENEWDREPYGMY